MTGNILQIFDLNKKFVTNQKEWTVLSDINLSIETGEFISIIGPSGCGKSTLLRIMGGLETKHDGQVVFQGETVSGPSRKRGLIFQDHRLLPWLTVAENIKFSLPSSTEHMDELIDENLKMVGLLEVKNSYPKELSGGMAQRVAIARALANRPEMLLLDEPFGALDAITKMHLQEELLRLWERERITMVIVTHDIDEAVYLGQRVFVMDAQPGRIKKIHRIELSVPRSRTNPEFHLKKDRIYEEFFQEQEKTFSYNI